MRFYNFLNEMTQKQLEDLEKFADRILDKFEIDVEFTKHFLDRVNDNRNDPEITVSELQKLFKKIKQNKGEKIKSVEDMEAVLRDMQTDLNLPVVVDFVDGEFEVTHKTIMRKKNFKTSNKVIRYN